MVGAAETGCLAGCAADDAHVGPVLRLIGLVTFHPAPSRARRPLLPGRCPIVCVQGDTKATLTVPVAAALSSFSTEGLWRARVVYLLLDVLQCPRKVNQRASLPQSAQKLFPPSWRSDRPLSCSAQDTFLPWKPAPSCPLSPAPLPGLRSFLFC